MTERPKWADMDITWMRELDRYKERVKHMSFELVEEAMTTIEVNFNREVQYGKPDDNLVEYWARIYNALEERKYEIEEPND